MAYASEAAFRIVTNFGVEDISVLDLAPLIGEADDAILRLATIEVYDEKLSGDCDGSNVLFTTKHKPIADTGFNESVTAADVTVYLVDYDSEMNEVHTETTVSDVNERDGIITLETAPTTSNAEVGVFVDYRYYPMPVNYAELKLAANYYLAHIVATAINGVGSYSGWLASARQQLHFARPGLKGVS